MEVGKWATDERILLDLEELAYVGQGFVLEGSSDQ